MDSGRFYFFIKAANFKALTTVIYVLSFKQSTSLKLILYNLAISHCLYT